MTYMGRQPNPQGRVVATYKYHAENGAYLGTKYRYENKAFRWVKERDGQQLPLDNEKREALPLYRADELAASDPLQSVWLCEGEKDADRLHSLGLLATSVPHGALANGKEWKARWVRSLRKHDQVCILEDNDEPGRQHAARVAAALLVTIPDVRVVRLPGLQEGGDVSDWLDAGHTLGELVEVAEATPQWTPPAWPSMTPLRAEPEELPEFPVEHLPRWLGDFMVEGARSLSTQVNLFALPALAAVAATVARKVTVHPWDDWYEPLNIYTLTAIGVGNSKTPAFKLVLAPFHRWMRDQAAAMRDEITNAKHALAVLQARLAAAKRLIAQPKTGPERVALEKEASTLALEVAKAERAFPRVDQLIASDATEEAMAELLSRNHGRMFMATDEGGPIRIMAGLYRDGVAAFEVYKHGHNGGDIIVDRKNKDHEPIRVHQAAITISLLAQPLILDELRTNRNFRSEGLVARFIYSLPKSTVGKRTAKPEGMTPKVRDEYAARIGKLLGLPFASDEHGGEAPHVMELSAEAVEALIAFKEEIEPRLGKGGDLEYVADWGNKISGLAVRIAGIITMAERAGQDEPWSAAVSGVAMNASLAIVRSWIIPHGVAALSLFGADPVAELAEHAVHIIQREGWERFKHNALFNKMRAPLDDNTKNLAPVLALLEEAGYIRSIGRKTATGGAPTGKYYDVNPQVHSRRATS